jgi:serine/threonine-protein kinase
VLVIGAAAVVVAAIAIGGGLFFARKKAPNATAATASVATQAPIVRGAIVIASDPAGATIWVNGEKRPDVTPSTLTKMSIGKPYEIKLTKDGYEDATQTVTLTDAEPSGAVSLALKKGLCSIDVSVRPVVGGVSLNLDGKPYPGSSIDGVTAGDQHKLIVLAPNYIAAPITFTGTTAEKKHFDVMLVKVDPNKKRNNDDSAAAASTGGSGKLNVSARGGWCNVTVDGTPRGPTPVAGIVLSAGNHSVTCTPEGGRPMGASVNVTADGTARYAFTIPQ